MAIAQNEKLSVAINAIVAALFLATMAYFHLGALFVSVLFAYFAIDQLRVLQRKWLVLTCFFIIVTAICLGLGFLIDQAIHNIPKAAEAAIPSIIEYAEQRNLELPFTDWGSLRSFALDSVREQLPLISSLTRSAAKQFVLVLAGVVIAASLYLTPGGERFESRAESGNMYAAIWRELSARFRSFYRSFTEVMKAQLVIATINSGMTSIFLLTIAMPHTPMLVAITFLCGLLPIIGNLISNSIIVCVGFTVSPQVGLSALVFLIVLHKLEYFLNSKVIGERIKNPVWLTLVGLIVGERILGIPGIILAPVFLHFFRVEASAIPVASEPTSNAKSQ
jgi:predicted PurR-regulated permease PerM